jgi:hypothetical protein
MNLRSIGGREATTRCRATLLAASPRRRVLPLVGLPTILPDPDYPCQGPTTYTGYGPRNLGDTAAAWTEIRPAALRPPVLILMLRTSLRATSGRPTRLPVPATPRSIYPLPMASAELRGARLASVAGSGKTRSTWPSTTISGNGRTGTSSALRIAATGSVSARTLSFESEGEQTPGAAIRSAEPRSPTMWRGGERTTAAIGSESEPASRTRRSRPTTAEVRSGSRLSRNPSGAFLSSCDGAPPDLVLIGVSTRSRRRRSAPRSPNLVLALGRLKHLWPIGAERLHAQLCNGETEHLLD